MRANPLIVSLITLALAGCYATTPDGKRVDVSLTYKEPTRFQLTPQEKEQVRARVLASLKDPASAKFTGAFDGYVSVMLPDDPPKGCAIVNAKNSFGGYTGNEWVCVPMPEWRKSHPLTQGKT